jgi:D-cysteine desulfhydrase
MAPMTVSIPQRVPLAEVPTPLQRLDRSRAALGGADLWIKRDDLTGLEVSGNKVRKLEFVVADALASGCDTLVTEGTSQSNHCRATAAVCARLGLKCVLLFRPEPPSGPPVGNHLLDVLFGAQTRHYARAEFAADREVIVADVLAELRSAGRVPRFTPAGASEPVGCWGYIRAMKELADQAAAAGLGDCDVVAAVSSGGTFAGMQLGRKLHGTEHLHLVGVPVSDDVRFHIDAVGRLCRETISKYDLSFSVEIDERDLLDGYVGEGYGIPYPDELDAVRLLARTDGIVLDPVYTGKAFCGLLAEVRGGRLGRDRPVIFLHTGGVFSNFAWPQVLAG